MVHGAFCFYLMRNKTPNLKADDDFKYMHCHWQHRNYTKKLNLTMTKSGLKTFVGCVERADVTEEFKGWKKMHVVTAVPAGHGFFSLACKYSPVPPDTTTFSIPILLAGNEYNIQGFDKLEIVHSLGNDSTNLRSFNYYLSD